MKKVGSVMSPSSEMKPQIAKPALMSPNNVTYVISLSDYCITIIGFSDSLTLMAFSLSKLQSMKTENASPVLIVKIDSQTNGHKFHVSPRQKQRKKNTNICWQRNKSGCEDKNNKTTAKIISATFFFFQV